MRGGSGRRGGLLNLRVRRMMTLRMATLVHDVLIGALAFLVSVRLRQDTAVFDANFLDYILASLTVGLLVGTVGFFAGMNRGIWRYASLADLVAIVRTATIALAAFTIAHFLLVRLEGIPRSTILIAWAFLILFLSAPRVAYRVYRNNRDTRRRLSVRGSERRRVVVVGANDNADAFIKSVTEQGGSAYEVVSIVDERERRVGRYIRHVCVDGTVADLPAIVEKLRRRDRAPDAILLARSLEDYARHARIEELIGTASDLGLEILRLPNLLDMQAVTSEIEIRPIRLEDLLPRQPLSLDPAKLADLIRGRAVLITGAGGSIGSELARQIAALAPSRLALLDASEFLLYSIEQELRETHPALALSGLLGNVRERESVRRRFEAFQPAIVFHAAALKHVPIVEAQPLEGIATNILGTRNVAEAAVEFGCEAMVLVSTDKAVNPANVMGACKRVAEMVCQGLDLRAAETGTRFVTVRFGNVLGSAGSVVPLFERQVRAGGPLTVTHPEIERYFMTIPEACMLVLHATAYRFDATLEGGRIFVLDMGRSVRLVDLARNIIRLSGRRPDTDVQIVYTGLRPGEKLYEELFDRRETLGETSVSGLLVASPRLIEPALVDRILAEMERVVDAGDERNALRLLRSTVPEFQTPLSKPLEPSGAAPIAIDRGTETQRLV